MKVEFGMGMQRGCEIPILADIHNMTELGIEQYPDQEVTLFNLKMALPIYMILWFILCFQPSISK